jgi:hypothetical protein
MTNASQKPISRSTSLVLVLSVWVTAACVNAQRGPQGPTRDATEVSGRELWKFETGG